MPTFSGNLIVNVMGLDVIGVSYEAKVIKRCTGRYIRIFALNLIHFISKDLGIGTSMQGSAYCTTSWAVVCRFPLDVEANTIGGFGLDLKRSYSVSASRETAISI